MVLIDVEVEVYLGDFETEDLIQELESRGINVFGEEIPGACMIDAAYMSLTDNTPEPIRDLVLEVAGRIV